jgi:hypothetical protein
VKRLLFVVLFGLAACEARSERAVPGTNTDVPVERMTAWEDCVLWRIRVGSGEKPVFVARCGKDVQTSIVEGCGKNCLRTVTVPTLEAQR